MIVLKRCLSLGKEFFMDTLKKEFVKYVSQNVLGMVGISLYILADTFFISQAVGAAGITALNLVLPVYGLIFAFGQMIGVGSAIRFAVAKEQRGKDKDLYFANALFFGTLMGALFIMIGIFSPEGLLALLGGDQEIIAVGKSYTRIFLCFAPFFAWNHICNAFVRNDGAPTTAMLATLLSSLFNIVFDYILMFPVGMGMPGAALATALSPLLGVIICMTHICSKKSSIRFAWNLSFRRLVKSCQLGISAFVGEFSSALITMVFNFLILGLTGNLGVAAYGVVANCALVGTAIFGGVAQGTQPLMSQAYGRGNKKEQSQLIKLGCLTAFALSILLYVGIYFGANEISQIFNSEHIEALNDYAVPGLRLYFLGFIFAGINMVLAICFSAMEKAKEAFVISVSRGILLILIFAVLLAKLLGMTGVWIAFAATELVTMIIAICMLFGRKENRKM